MSDTRTEREVAAAEEKAAADAAIAELDRQRKEQELAEWLAARSLRDREGSAKVRQLEQENAQTGRAAIKDLVPDLTKVTPGSTTAPESATMFDALLAGQALQESAKALAQLVWAQGLFTEKTLLITTDLDLAARDGQRHAVVQRLEHLRRLVDTHLHPQRDLVGGGAELALAAAALLPGLLSLLSPRNSVSASSSTTDDTVAMMAAAGALAASEGCRVVLDRARFVSTEPGPVRRAWNDLDRACRELETWTEDERAKVAPDVDRLAEGDALLETCRTASVALSEVPAGSSLSPLAAAELQEVLRSGEFEAILVVKGGAASATQLIEDRRFASDKVSILSTASIAYVLLDHRAGCRVAAAGLAHGSRTFSGTIGSAGTFASTLA